MAGVLAGRSRGFVVGGLVGGLIFPSGGISIGVFVGVTGLLSLCSMSSRSSIVVPLFRRRLITERMTDSLLGGAGGMFLASSSAPRDGMVGPLLGGGFSSTSGHFVLGLVFKGSNANGSAAYLYQSI